MSKDLIWYLLKFKRLAFYFDNQLSSRELIEWSFLLNDIKFNRSYSSWIIYSIFIFYFEFGAVATLEFTSLYGAPVTLVHHPIPPVLSLSALNTPPSLHGFGQVFCGQNTPDAFREMLSRDLPLMGQSWCRHVLPVVLWGPANLRTCHPVLPLLCLSEIPPSPRGLRLGSGAPSLVRPAAAHCAPWVHSYHRHWFPSCDAPTCSLPLPSPSKSFFNLPPCPFLALETSQRFILSLILLRLLSDTYWLPWWKWLCLFRLLIVSLIFCFVLAISFKMHVISCTVETMNIWFKNKKKAPSTK